MIIDRMKRIFGWGASVPFALCGLCGGGCESVPDCFNRAQKLAEDGAYWDGGKWVLDVDKPTDASDLPDPLLYGGVHDCRAAARLAVELADTTKRAMSQLDERLSVMERGRQGMRLLRMISGQAKEISDLKHRAELQGELIAKQAAAIGEAKERITALEDHVRGIRAIDAPPKWTREVEDDGLVVYRGANGGGVSFGEYEYEDVERKLDALDQYID